MREIILERIKYMKENGGWYFNNGWTVVDLDHKNLNDKELLDAYTDMKRIFDDGEDECDV